MDQVFDWSGRGWQLRPEPYWHLVPREGSFLLNNAYLAHGICPSISVARQQGLPGAVSPYGFVNITNAKEQAWERSRLAVDAALPTRMHAFFFFDEKAAAEYAMRTWFVSEDRLLLEARITTSAKIHRADAKWLDCLPDRWEENSRSYWRGEMTSAPMAETIVEGEVYFLNWDRAPFGVGAGLIRAAIDG